MLAGGVMSDTQRGFPPGLDRIAYERRARIIAQLHKQAIANDLSAQDKAIRADITTRQETVFWTSIAGAFIVALGSILALLAMMQ